MNFRALISYFFQKNFQPRFTRHEYYSSFAFFWSHFAHYPVADPGAMRAMSSSVPDKDFLLFTSWHFLVYIILTQALTFLVCKDWSKVFLHTLLHRNIIFFCKTVLKFQQKCAHDSRNIHIWK